MRIQLNVRLPEHTIAQIQALAAEMDESQAHVIIIAVDRMAQMSKGNSEMNKNEIVERVGAENWKMVKKAYGEMTKGEIVANMYYMWPHEGEANEELASAIYEELN